MTRIKLAEQLREYFINKGRFLSYAEYAAEEDTPVRAQVVKRILGPWGRVEKLIGEIVVEQTKPEVKPVAQIKSVVDPKVAKK